MSDSTILQGNTLYLALLWRGDAHSWHYGLYLPDPAYRRGSTELLEHGTFFHCMNLNAECAWRYEAVPPAAVSVKRRLVYAIRIADMNALGPYADVVESMTATLEDVPVNTYAPKEVFNCVTWAITALGCLEENGYIEVKDIDRTSSSLYLARVLEATRKYDEGRGVFTVTTWERCNV